MIKTNKLKTSKKCSKYRKFLLNEFGPIDSDVCTENLMVCNAGLVTGIQREDIVDFFNQFGPISNVCMFPGKSFSFVTFKNVNDAERCFTTVNGNLTMKKMNGPVYLLYTNRVPDDPKVKFFFGRPPGAIVLDDFVTAEEEKAFLEYVDFTKVEAAQNLKHRQVKHFGYDFCYDTNNVDKDKPTLEPIPEMCSFLRERVNARGFNLTWEPDQLTVNKYLPGQGIPPHVDTHSAFEDPILSLSLGSDILMDFKSKDNEHYSSYLPRRSLLIMSGESRYAWTHGIAPRKHDVITNSNGELTTFERGIRLSFTFRRVREKSCNCCFPSLCDSQIENDMNLSNKAAEEIENVYVHQVYQKISEHFSETRYAAWPNVLEFVNSLKGGSILIDIGCGNGKYFEHNKGIIEIGCDQSLSLLHTCKRRGFEIVLSNCLALPFQSNIADAVICIAVIHHLATKDRRVKAIGEILRVLKPGCQAVIYVWAKNQNLGSETTKYLKESDAASKADFPTNVSVSLGPGESSEGNDTVSEPSSVVLPVHSNRTTFKHKDLLVPWTLNPKQSEDGEENTFLRFYHVFEEGELDELFKEFPESIILKSYYDQGNWCVVCSKR